jgi:hypothetical protein
MPQLTESLIVEHESSIVNPVAAGEVQHRARLYPWVLVACAAVAGITAAAWMWVAPPPLVRSPLLPVPLIENGRVSLRVPGYVVTSDVIAYRDELFAYLMFDYLRHNPAFEKNRLMLMYDQRRTATRPYRLIVYGQDDVLTAVAAVQSVDIAGIEVKRSWELMPAAKVTDIERQTQLFVGAYNLPVRRKLEDVPREAVSAYLQRFIRFKSATDPRIRRRIEPIPRPLSSDDARQLAGDIITIAEFFELPLEFLLGIGAMENNYMNVRGDLTHSIWKRRPAPDDVVLERRRGRVRVLNDSAGVWQITRETLRYAHELTQTDGRDYSQLPEHLQPRAELNVNEVDPTVLTTYAGVLLRDLLDRFDGDVTLAVSAYNGGPGRPNLRYGEGVHSAAEHARRVLEQAAVLNGESVMQRQWLRP